MSNRIILVENVSKKFILSHDGEVKYKSLRDEITKNAKGVFQSKKVDHSREDFFALSNISFELNQGDRLGVIGRNGAGKSTLLKILSRITEPTAGRISIKGRVSSLLEVGTGFHPELTGRENIFLNGAILGMSRLEIKSKFDEIVDFAEVEKFLDTPVKRFSSGMYVRLAFAIAAHLEPEILIVDEVLAVGDAKFQEKCLGKMNEVSKKDGRTILFVSHNIGAVRSLCNKGMVLKKGSIDFFGKVSDAIERYENADEVSDEGYWVNSEPDIYDARIESISIMNSANLVRANFINEEEIKIVIKTKFNKELEYVKIGFDLIKEGVIVCRSQQIDDINIHKFSDQNEYSFVCTIPAHFLNHGTYYIRPLFSIHNVTSLISGFDTALKFQVDLEKSSYFKMVLNEQNFPGVIYPKFNWVCSK